MKISRATLPLPSQRQSSGGRSPRATIDILPEVALLEIFESYRQALEQEPDYELVWNGKTGWFNLAHVCRTWRSVILSSPSRLQVRLLFTSPRSAWAKVLTNLPPFPIVVNYGSERLLTIKKQNRMVATLRYPDRVRRIVFHGPDSTLDGVHKAMSRPFVALESLELLSSDNQIFKLPSTIFGGSAPSLRHLVLQHVSLASLSPLLSCTTGLVYLDLGVDGVYCPSPATSLLTHLQGLPCLRRLHLRLPTSRRLGTLPMRPADIVRLLKLTHFQYYGNREYLEPLVAGLAAPSLQDLIIEFNGFCNTFNVPHFSRFISDVEGLIFAVQVSILSTGPRISMFTHPHAPDEPPCRITLRDQYHRLVRGDPGALNAKLATAEQFFFQCNRPCGERWLCGNTFFWRELFEQLWNVKILRVQTYFLLDVAQFLVQNGGEPPSHLLPALEEIELRPVAPDSASFTNRDLCEVLSTFGTFVSTRQQGGCPVRISWNADPALPSPYVAWEGN